MKKVTTITVLTLSTLALASCSNNNGTSSSPTQVDTSASATVSTVETVTETKTVTTESSAQTSSAEAPAPGVGHRFDEAAIKQGFSVLGYNCNDSNECAKTDGTTIYDIEVDDDSIEATVQGNNDMDTHFHTLLSDVGTVLGTGDLGGASWYEVETWAQGAADKDHTTFDRLKVEHKRADKDGVPTRSVELDLKKN
ncbi:MAG: hypothetical protein SOW59_04090 [Corynebacterium sp.]|nr:hypothetical protein [Corynebacterium sp.]